MVGRKDGVPEKRKLRKQKEKENFTDKGLSNFISILYHKNIYKNR